MTRARARDKDALVDPLALRFDRYRRDGDLHALGDVFDALSPRLLSVAMHLCGNPADAEDALQQTFLLALDRADSFDAARRLEPWLAGLLANAVRNLVRSAGRRRAEPLPEHMSAPDDGPQAVAERAELAALLRTHVDALPADQRQVLRLQLQHGLQPAAIAEVLELPPGTVRMRLHRGLDALRRLLPASLAALLAAALPARGLAAVRHAVLQAGQAKWAAAGGAGGAAATVSTAAMFGGALAMKKLGVVVAFVVVVGAAWWLGTDLPGPDVPSTSSPAAGARPVAADLPAAPLAPLPDARAGERTAAPVAAAIGDAPREPGPTELWGLVVEAGTRRPIEGADVELLHCDADEFWNLDLAYGERVASLARRRTGADGRFRFDVARARAHRLAVRAIGFAPAVALQCTGGSDVVVELARGASVSGVVRSAGKPVADATVRLAVRGVTVELALARTDHDGAFRCADVAPANAFVQVRANDLQEHWREIDIAAGTSQHLEIELEAGRTLRGRVVDAGTGAPIADARVSDSWTMRRVVRTDADGRFALLGLRDDSFVMCHVEARGYATAGRNVGGALDRPAEFRLVRGGDVAGRIVDEHAAPLANAYAAVCTEIVEAPGMRGADWIAATVAADGRFVAVGLRPAQHYWLYVRAAGFGTRVYALARALGSGERLDVGDVVLRAAGGVEGRVVDDAGAGMPGLSVSIAGTNGDRLAWLEGGARLEPVTQFERRSGRTDEAGRFRFGGLAGGTYEISVRPPGRGAAIATNVDVEDGARRDDVVLTIAVGRSLSGTLVRDPAAGTEPLYLTATPQHRGGGDDYSAKVGADGSFRFDGLADGVYTITLLSPPKDWVLAPQLGVAAGATNLRLVLERAAFVSGRVVDLAGKPVKVQLWARPDGVDAGLRVHLTDDEGRFRIAVAPSFRGTIGGAPPDSPLQYGKADGVVAGQADVVVTVQRR